MNPEQAIEQWAQQLDSAFFAALAEPVRIALLREMLLMVEPVDVGTLAARMPQDRSVVSRHLKTLLEVGIVTCSKTGRHRYYQLDGPALLERLETLTSLTRSAMPLCCPG